MKNKSYILLICLSLLPVASLVSCCHADARVVFKVPDGFALLAELDKREDSILDYVFWDSQISFVDTPAKICIYQEFVGNRNFIVKYKGEYYVNEAKYLELIDVAVLAQEERKRTYSIGDTVEILGANKIYYVTITGLEETVIDSKKIFNINFTTTPDTTMVELKSIFALVEISKGEKKVSGNVFDFIDAETVRLEMNSDRKLDALILKSPEYMGLTYRVLMNQ